MQKLDERSSPWTMLEQARERCETLGEELRAATAERDEAIRALSRRGISRRAIAKAAGVTAARVQQIVALDRLPDLDVHATPAALSALQQANRVRLVRADLKRRVADGELSAAEVLLDPPPEVESMAIGDLLMSQRRWGGTRTRKLLAAFRVSEMKIIGSLTTSQRIAIASQVAARAALDRGRGVKDVAVPVE